MTPKASEFRSPFLPTRGVIKSIIPLAPENHLFQIQMTEEGAMSGLMPGQFVQLWIPGVGEAPISVCSGHMDDRLELCVRRVGRVTSGLFQMEEEDWVGLRGPYGTGFPIDEYRGKNLVLIAGGLGVAPIRSLWQYVLDHRQDYGRVIIIYGMRHSVDLLFRAEFKILMRRRDLEVYIAAEDVIGPELPPVAFQLGRVTDMIELAEITPDFCVAVCGPPVMYPYVVASLAAKGVSESNIWLSLERHMKCAVGKCGHCFAGDKFTCMKGPVFNLPVLRLLPDLLECGENENAS